MKIDRVKYWEIIADNLSKAGWSWGCVSAIDSNGRKIFVADAHRRRRKAFRCARGRKAGCVYGTGIGDSGDLPVSRTDPLLSDTAQAQKRTTRVS
jgi:hypothetical protein